MSCSNLFILSALACQLSNCLTDDELAMLSADLMTLGDMLESIAVRKEICEKTSSES